HRGRLPPVGRLLRDGQRRREDRLLGRADGRAPPGVRLAGRQAQRRDLRRRRRPGGVLQQSREGRRLGRGPDVGRIANPPYERASESCQSIPKSPLTFRQLEWMWLAGFFAESPCVLTYSITN